MTTLRRLLPVLLIALIAVPAAAEDAGQAAKDLTQLETFIKKKRKTIPEDYIAYLDAVKKAYGNFTKPPKPADDAGEEEKKAHANELKKVVKAQADFDKKAEKAIFKCLTITRLDRSQTTNELDEVNIRAAKILGELGSTMAEKKRDSISKKVIKEIEGLDKAKHDVRSDLLEQMFMTLAQLNRPSGLSWMVDNYIHTKSRDEDVIRLVAAHKAMIEFKEVPGKLRYAICKDMITTYSSVESQAEQSTNDPNIQAKKAFWDRIRVDAIKVVQFFGGEPQDEDQQVINTMGGFQRWWRSVKAPKHALWKDEKIKK